MQRLTVLVVGAAMALGSAACSKPAGTLEAAEETLGAANVKSIEYSGTGKWFQFGQAPNPTLPWPPFDVSSFKAAINYDDTEPRAWKWCASRRSSRRACGRLRSSSAPFRSSAARPPGTSRRRQARRRQRRPSAAAARGRRGADDGDLGDAAGLPEGGARQQRDVGAGKRRLHRDVHRRREGNTSARSTRRTRWRRCRRGSTRRCSATRWSRRPTPTTRISAA